MEIINIIANIFFIVSLLLKFARTLFLYNLAINTGTSPVLTKFSSMIYFG